MNKIMEEVRSTSIEFCHKQTWFGIVLMVRTAQYTDSPGMWEWSRWRKAEYFEYEEYMSRSKQ